MDRDTAAYRVEEKMAASQKMADQQESISHALNGMAGAMACRSSLRDSIISRYQRAESSMNEAHRLKRLIDLLDKHSEVLEVFELMRDLNLL